MSNATTAVHPDTLPGCAVRRNAINVGDAMLGGGTGGGRESTIQRTAGNVSIADSMAIGQINATPMNDEDAEIVCAGLVSGGNKECITLSIADNRRRIRPI